MLTLRKFFPDFQHDSKTLLRLKIYDEFTFPELDEFHGIIIIKQLNKRTRTESFQ